MRAGRAANSHHPLPGSPFFSSEDRPVLPLLFSFCQDRGHAHDGGARRRWIAVRMPAWRFRWAKHPREVSKDRKLAVGPSGRKML